MIQRTCLPPNTIIKPQNGDYSLEGHEIEHALVLILLFVLIILLLWFPFVTYGYYPPERSIRSRLCHGYRRAFHLYHRP
jgi:hypothetical protein